MGIVTIDGIEVEFTDERNLLTVIKKAGIDIPTLCYIDELSTFGDCRLGPKWSFAACFRWKASRDLIKGKSFSSTSGSFAEETGR